MLPIRDLFTKTWPSTSVKLIPSTKYLMKLSFFFLKVNDGSSLQGLQVVVNKDAQGYDTLSEGKMSTGAAVQVSGVLIKSPGGKQSVNYYPDSGSNLCLKFCSAAWKRLQLHMKLNEELISCLRVTNISACEEKIACFLLITKLSITSSLFEFD